MAYFIFNKNSDDVQNTLFKIVENQSDLNNLLIDQSNHKIIEVDQKNFDDVKYGNKTPLKYNGNTISYIDYEYSINDLYFTKDSLNEYILNFKKIIKQFLDNNKNHNSFNIWNDYYNQLNSLNTATITFPLLKSLEKYFYDLGKISLNPLQLP